MTSEQIESLVRELREALSWSDYNDRYTSILTSAFSKREQEVREETVEECKAHILANTKNKGYVFTAIAESLDQLKTPKEQ